jgi:hypothetical protein
MEPKSEVRQDSDQVVKSRVLDPQSLRSPSGFLPDSGRLTG